MVLRAYGEDGEPARSGYGTDEDLLAKNGLSASYEYWRRAVDGGGDAAAGEAGPSAPAADAPAARKGKRKLTTKIKIKKMRPRHAAGEEEPSAAPAADAGRALSASERALPGLAQSDYGKILRGDTVLRARAGGELLPLVRPNAEEQAEFQELLRAAGVDPSDVKLKPFKKSDLMCVHDMG